MDLVLYTTSAKQCLDTYRSHGDQSASTASVCHAQHVGRREAHWRLTAPASKTGWATRWTIFTGVRPGRGG